MQNELTLQDFPMGEMGEIVSLTKEHETAIYQELGIDVGMTVMVLHKAVDWLIKWATARFTSANSICRISK